jgi:DNA polymerase-1
MKDFISIDIETNGKDPRRAKLLVVGYAYSNGQAGYYKYPEELDAIKSLMANPLPKLAHNIKFDYKVLQCHGIDVRGELEDTLILSQMHGHLPCKNYKLKSLVNAIFNKNLPSYNDLLVEYNKDIKKKDRLVSNIPIDILGKYCINDCLITIDLYLWLLNNITTNNNINISHQDTYSIYTTIEKPLLPVVLDIEHVGINIDIPKLHSSIAAGKLGLDIMKDLIFDYAGEIFNINPSYDLERVLYSKFNHPILKINGKNGRPCTDEKVLHRLSRAGYILPRYILEYRYLYKLCNTYYKDYTKWAIDGKVYPNLNQTGTDTGRFSASNPNMQNVHSEAKSLFVASKGNRLVSFDYKQMEMVMGAVLSCDKLMVKAVDEGKDLHQVTMDELKVDRRQAKAINFGIFYGQTEFGLAKAIHTKMEKAKEYLNAYHALHPKIREYGDSQVLKATELGYVETILGRKRFLDVKKMKPQEKYSVCINTPIQGSCADLIKLAMINIYKKGYTPILQVHDELLFDLPKDVVKKAVGIIKHEMENAYKLPVPMRVDVKIGVDWGKMHKVTPI